MTRIAYDAAVEAGAVTDFARLDLGDVYLWLYPLENGRVRVETEDKPARLLPDARTIDRVGS